MAQYSDPYENWKAAGRPGGSFAAWQASQAAPAAAPSAPAAAPVAPAAPAPAAPAQPAAAAPPPGEDFNSWFQRANAVGGGNFDPNSAESQAQYQQHLATLRDPSQGGGMGGC